MNLENKKQIATIFLAVGLGLVAVFLTNQYVLRQQEEQAKKLNQTIQKTSAALAQQIDDQNRKLNALGAEQQAMATRQEQLIKQQIAQAQLQGAGAAVERRPPSVESFALKTPPGKRAYTIQIDSLSAVGGLIRAGDFVDVIAQLSVPEEEGSPSKSKNVTTVLFQNLQVLAVGTNFQSVGGQEIYNDQQRAGALRITLAVSTEEAGLLIFAQNNGRFQLSLRGPTETKTENIKIASWDALADFIREKQGTELAVPKSKASISSGASKTPKDEVKPFIQIFKAGTQL